MIKAEQLHCHYSDSAFLDDLNFHIKRHLTILGANGSGKSMLAKTLCGLLPYEGSLTLDGNELNTLKANTLAKTLSYIPAKLEIFDSYTTVEEFALLGKYPYKEPFLDYSQSDRDEVSRTLKQLQLDAFCHHTITTLSSGQQQLLLIAQSILQKSQIMIFDEPTANLDPYNTLEFSKLFKRLQHDHTTILITHDLTLASHLGGSILFLRDHGALFYEDGAEFFQGETLKELYGVSFHSASKAICYA
jgi:iron complex transport system ATP-binding protein